MLYSAGQYDTYQIRCPGSTQHCDSLSIDSTLPSWVQHDIWYRYAARLQAAARNLIWATPAGTRDNRSISSVAWGFACLICNSITHTVMLSDIRKKCWTTTRVSPYCVVVDLKIKLECSFCKTRVSFALLGHVRLLGSRRDVFLQIPSTVPPMECVSLGNIVRRIRRI